ncbi:hypothetical protein MMC17_009887 [Xylographa soralifera]|nr:hypothetical protein [Xylographa soralifera]
MDRGTLVENAFSGKAAKTASFELERGRQLGQAVTEVTRSGLFPAELLFVIFGHLDKKDCKAIRLVSTTWSAVVTSQLFDVVHFAIREKELDVFAKLTEHPIISRSVTQLDYDLSRFVTKMSAGEYVVSLVDQIEGFLIGLPEKSIFDGNDEESMELIELVRQASSTPTWWQWLEKSPVVIAGFRNYTRFAEQQEVLLQTQCYHDILLRGLARLPNLHSIVISNDWQLSGAFKDSVGTTTAPVYFTSLPSAHVWNLLHLYPGNKHESIAVHHPELEALFQALKLVKAPVDEISFSLFRDTSFIPNSTFELADAKWEYLLQAYQGLISLNLHFFGISESFRVLPRIPGSLPLLEKLLINVSYDVGYLSIGLLFELPFRTCPRLHTVWLGRIVTSFQDLRQFLRTNAQLKTLTFSYLWLFPGIFVDVFDTLRTDLKLTCFRIVGPLQEGRKRCRIRRASDDSTEEDQQNLWSDIEAYVLYGGLNPLRASQVSTEY